MKDFEIILNGGNGPEEIGVLSDLICCDIDGVCCDGVCCDVGCDIDWACGDVGCDLDSGCDPNCGLERAGSSLRR